MPEAGVLVADRSDTSIRDGIVRVLASPPDRPATRAYAERYDWHATGRQHRALLAAAIQGYRARTDAAAQALRKV